MITTKAELYEYIQEDIKALYDGEGKPSIRTKLGINRVHFQILLRKAEYHTNTNHRFRGIIFRYRCRNIGRKCGFSIPLNVCGKGLNIAHEGTIIISNKAVIGDYCRIHAGVNIGVNGSIPGAPKIGNYVYFAPGVKVFGPVSIADGIAIGANAVVNRSFSEKNITIAGIPAKKISDKGSKSLLYMNSDY